MDPYELDLNPAMTSGIFFHQTNSNDELNLLDDHEFSNFGKPGLEDNFTDNFNNVFQPISPDNKEDSISEDNISNISNVDEFILHFQNENINNYYFKKDFDGIINQIEKQFPFFFNEKNTGLLYLIEKLRFFDLLKEKKIEEAKKFYQEKLLILIKEVKKQSWETKCKFFLKLIKKPILIDKQGDLQKKYYDQFTFELEKAIRNFLNEDNNDDEDKNEDILSNSNSNNINLFVSSSSLDFYKLDKINFNKDQKNKNMKKNKNKKKEITNNKETNDGDNKINTNINNNNNNNEESEEIDLDNLSTKEEFSDFEDELAPKNSNENNDPKKSNQIENNNKIINNFINENMEDIEDLALDPVNNNSPLFQNLSLTSFSKSHKSSYEIEQIPQNKEENEFIIDTSSKNNLNFIEEKSNINEYKFVNIQENNNYKNIYANEKCSKKKNNKKEKNKNEETIFNQLPFLKSFKPKYIKRETIDKKIIRTFKNFVVKENKEKRLEINTATMDYSFFINLIYGNLLPPIDFVDGTTGEEIKFNSFNCNYLLWFFSKKGVKDVYLRFISQKGKEFINNLSKHYEISLEEKNQLNDYISNFPFIFDITLVNNITNGVEITHIYRTVDKNKMLQKNRRNKREKELDLKRNKSGSSLDLHRERSRSREF